MNTRPITEDDLQAFIDNALDAERHREVSGYLQTNPEAAKRAASHRAQAAALRLALDPVAREPVPSRLNLKNIAATTRTPARRVHSFKLAAAAVALLAVPVEVRADGNETLQKFAASTLGRSASIPDLSKAGYRLMGGRVIPTAHGPGFMLMYDNDKGSRLVMLARHMLVDQDKPMAASESAEVRGWSWAKNGMGYSLVGPLPHEELHPIADAVRSQI